MGATRVSCRPRRRRGVDLECVDGAPAVITLRGRRILVAEVVDEWLVEDEWWRTPVARRYLQLALADGRLLTVFQDCITTDWYAQPYRSRTADIER